MTTNIKGCTKPDCDCLEKAEERNGYPVKSYPCLHYDRGQFDEKKTDHTTKPSETMSDEVIEAMTDRYVGKNKFNERSVFKMGVNSTIEHFQPLLSAASSRIAELEKFIQHLSDSYGDEWTNAENERVDKILKP